MYTVQKEELMSCLLDFPEIKEYMVMIAKSRKGRIDLINSGEVISEFVDDEDCKTELFMDTVNGEGVGSPGAPGNEHLNNAGRRSSTASNQPRGSRRGSGLGLDSEAVQKIVQRQQKKEQSVRGKARNGRRRASDLSFKENSKYLVR